MAAPRSSFRDGLVRGSVSGRNAAWLRLGPADGLPVVVLHGAGLDRAGASWRRVIPRLAEFHPVIAPDLPGHGETDALRCFRGVSDYARWLLSYFDVLGIRRAAVTGVSMGGAIGLRVALDAPDRIAGVIPVASYGLSRRAPYHPLLHAGTRLPLARMSDRLIARSSSAAWIALRALVHDPSTISHDMVAELRAIAAETDSEHSFDRFLETEIRPDSFNTYLGDDLRRLEVPVHFVHGLHDAAVPIAAARETAVRIGAPLTELDAGHWPMFEAPEAYLEVAQRFLGEIET
jgi:pimeloyl-ACP methyl ester carboxylesterase